MRHWAIALGLLCAAAFAVSPLGAAPRAGHGSVLLVKGKKAKSKFKAHKAIKRKAHPVIRH